MNVFHILTIALVYVYVFVSHPSHSIGVYICVVHTLAIALVCVYVHGSHLNHTIGVHVCVCFIP